MPFIQVTPELRDKYRQFREKAGFSITDAAKKLGYKSKSSLGDFEQGRRKMVREEFLIKLNNLYDCTQGDALNECAQKKKHDTLSDAVSALKEIAELHAELFKKAHQAKTSLENYISSGKAKKEITPDEKTSPLETLHKGIEYLQAAAKHYLAASAEERENMREEFDKGYISGLTGLISALIISEEALERFNQFKVKGGKI